MAAVLNRTEILEKLYKVYRSYYNITEFEEEQRPLIARCDFFEHSEKYVLSRKANLWSADGEEFLYLFEIPHLTKEIYEACMNQAVEDGMGRMHIGPGHMYSYITAEFLCDTCDPDAVTALKKSRLRKSFHFSLHGWMEYHAAMVIAGESRVEANSAGRNAKKILKKVLYSKR